MPAVNQRFAVAAVYVAAMFVSILDGTVVNVALPSMARSFHEEAAQMSAISVGYLVAVAVVIPASGWLGERFGAKRVLLAAFAVFTAASALCGAAQDLPQLVGFRVLQGLGGGALVPVGMTMLFHVFDQRERMRAARIMTVPTTMAPISGPIIGGLLVDHASWRWVFYINLPIGIVVLILGALFLRDTVERRHRPFDGPGFALSALGFAGIMYALSEGANRGWGTPDVLGLGLGGLLLTAVLVRHELRAAHPLLDLRVFADRMFTVANLIALLANCAFLGTLFIFPLMLQEGFGYDAVQSGLSTFPEAVGVLCSVQVVSRIYGRIGPRRMMAAGLLCVAAVIAGLSTVDRTTDPWTLRLLLFCCGLCMPYVFNTAQTSAFARIGRQRTGQASTLFNAVRQLGMAAGVGVAGTVISAVGPLRAGPHGHPVANLTAYHTALQTAAGLAVAGAVLALFVRDADAASTLNPAKAQRLTGGTRAEDGLRSPTPRT